MFFFSRVCVFYFSPLNPKRAKSLRNIVTVNRQRSNYELLQIIEMLKKCAPSPALPHFAHQLF
jgi:hypothetical protein